GGNATDEGGLHRAPENLMLVKAVRAPAMKAAAMSDFDTAFQVSMSNLRFGPGATREIGMDLEDMDLRRTLLVIDSRLVDLPTGQVVLGALRQARVDFEVFDAVEVEPTDRSFQEVIGAACRGKFDSFVAVGGGS